MEQNIRNTIADTISGFHMPRFDDIPGVGLYLEQTVSYINEYLSPILDGAVTGSMISNYVKKKMVSNPVRKQYSREQIASLFFIAVTKSVLSLDNIRVLLAIRDARYKDRTAYNYFCGELESVLRLVFGLDEADDALTAAEMSKADEPAESDPRLAEEKEILQNTVIAVAHKIYLDKWILQYAVCDNRRGGKIE